MDHINQLMTRLFVEQPLALPGSIARRYVSKRESLG